MKAVQRETFQKIVWDFYADHGRHDLSWRQPNVIGKFDPYAIMVSEMMLQQTQVSRVIPKFQQFMELFPTVEKLAAAPLSTVLIAWSGLGYNRRAKYIHLAANIITDNHDGWFPDSLEGLQALPGIGMNTAGAILAYAYNAPVVFIETNIRTVFIHHFFADQTNVLDASILELMHEMLPAQRSREWYWALMDYGTYLKQQNGNLNKFSKHYTVQSRFEGSVRQIRGAVIRELTLSPLSTRQLEERIPDARLTEVLAKLTSEALISYANGNYELKS